MKSPFSQDFDPLHFTLSIVFMLTFFGQFFVSMWFGAKSIPYIVYEIFWSCIVGLFFLYSGIKKLRQRKEQHESTHWYTQPGILYGFAVFFLLPFYVLRLIFGAETIDTLPLFLEIVLFAPTGICILASAFFFFRRLLFFDRA